MNAAENTPENVSQQPSLSEDFSRALSSARIACYDNFRSAPRVTEIEPTTTAEFIENLASTIYTQAQQAGGEIPYTVIREVSENFIHAQFREVVVSIFDKGNTIRFSDQGPGIPEKGKAQQPGFSSAIEPMKRYIRGVGSGLPLVKEYLSFSHGRITIEDNLNKGAVVTISVNSEPEPAPAPQQVVERVTIPVLSDREKDALFLFYNKGALRLTDVVNELDCSPSTVHRLLEKLDKEGLVVSGPNKMRTLTDLGSKVVDALM